MFLIIGVWGGARRVYAAFKFFLYTLAGSVLMLVALLYIFGTAGTTDMTKLMGYGFTRQAQTWLWLAFFASFAVKVPMWPVHTWLPDAHVEAPTAGSVILAGVLLKMGAYGFLRFSLPMMPDASAAFTPLVYTLSIIAVVYTSLVALVQEDMKKLIAYSSVAHMGFVTLGIFTGTRQGIDGALFQMLSHGVVSGALFLCVGVVYDRLHTRQIARYGGLVERMPRYAAVFMLFAMASAGLPGTSGFVGEFLVLAGAFQVDTWTCAAWRTCRGGRSRSSRRWSWSCCGWASIPSRCSTCFRPRSTSWWRATSRPRPTAIRPPRRAGSPRSRSDCDDRSGLFPLRRAARDLPRRLGARSRPLRRARR
jgi:NADH-quinone oxidoreductase subunit M